MAWEVKLGHGDVLCMDGMMQKHYLHRVPKEDFLKGIRINLTWRWVCEDGVTTDIGGTKHVHIDRSTTQNDAGRIFNKAAQLAADLAHGVTSKNICCFRQHLCPRSWRCTNDFCTFAHHRSEVVRGNQQQHVAAASAYFGEYVVWKRHVQQNLKEVGNGKWRKWYVLESLRETHLPRPSSPRVCFTRHFHPKCAE